MIVAHRFGCYEQKIIPLIIASFLLGACQSQDPVKSPMQDENHIKQGYLELIPGEKTLFDVNCKDETIKDNETGKWMSKQDVIDSTEDSYAQATGLGYHAQLIESTCS